jgi:hypothetical protein
MHYSRNCEYLADHQIVQIVCNNWESQNAMHNDLNGEINYQKYQKILINFLKTVHL